MSKPSYFYVAYPENQRLRDLINAIKIIADDNQRTEAHITIRGPYNRRLSKKLVNKYSNIIFNQTLHITQIDNFFDYNQNTVFFKCSENEALRKIWKKTTYSDFNPHITIYNGEDNSYARKLYNTLCKNFKPFEYKINDLSCIQPKTNDPLRILYLKIEFKSKILTEILKTPFNIQDISNYSEDKKLSILEIISSHLYNELFIENSILV